MELLNEGAVIAMTGLPRTTLHRHVSTGSFPVPMKPDGWHNAWRREDVMAWMHIRAVVADAAELSDADPVDLMGLASSCSPVLLERVFPRVASLGVLS